MVVNGALLDMRGKDTTEAAKSAARACGGIVGPVHTLSAPQQRLFTRALFEATLAQMEQRMIEEQMLAEEGDDDAQDTAQQSKDDEKDTTNEA